MSSPTESLFDRRSQLSAELTLTHRSPTYAIQLLGTERVLRVRREADVCKPDGSIDRTVARDYGGHVHWWAECDGREAVGANLGKALLGALGPHTTASTLFQVTLALAEAAVPNEPPIRLEEP